ncbi:MAG: Eco29kI family restriction endonuclease [Rhodomicrobium sp.]
MIDGPYNPLAKINLGRSVARALLTVAPRPLSETDDLRGAGVYAIYYIGAFPGYAPIAAHNRDGRFEQPIYVGKAIPRGGRKGLLSEASAVGTALRDRLRQHASSVNEAKNLQMEDFLYRSLIVDDIWIPLGENMLIEKFKPVWNIVIDGFGNKDPGNRRATQVKSPWDVLHPGRAVMEKLADSALRPEALVAKLDAFFKGENVTLVEPTQADEEADN